MANLKQLRTKSSATRKNRYFSEELKQKLVRELENNMVTVSEIAREHQVRRWSVYKWINKYSSMRKKSVRTVVESKSLTKTVTNLKAKIKELEQLIGQKQVTIEYLEKMIELTEQDLGIDIKKKREKITLFWFWTNRDQMNFSLNQLYKSIPLKKQSMHEWIGRQLSLKDEWEQLIPIIKSIRKDHPGMAARKLYHMIQPETIGRDKFIELCMECGFRLEVKRNVMRTTNSLGVTKFPNLIQGIQVKRINQIWVSDITFYRIGNRFYYITFIMDLKSRYIVSHHVSKTLNTEDTTLAALKKILSIRNIPRGLIIHSDGGGQYYCKEYLALTKKHFIKNSMTEDVGENNHAERINGTIKNQYLSGYMPTHFDQLISHTDRAVNNYNLYRPHESLKLATPSSIYRISTKK